MDQRAYMKTSNSHPHKKRRRRRAVHILLCFLVVMLGAFAYQVWAEARELGEPRTESVPMTDLTESTPLTPEKPVMPEVDVPEEPAEPEFSADDWQLLLVNPWNEVPADYSVALRHLRNKQAVDKRCYPDLQEMMDDCRAAGLSPRICSSYRTQEKQEALFKNKVSHLMAQGYSREEAEIEAATVVAVPGTSEHQTGLAVDIVDKSHQILDETQEDTAVQQWLMEHSWEYGFILRYPNGKSDVTGIIYEPWHYRYVGKEAAADIYEQDITLEEYVEQLG